MVNFLEQCKIQLISIRVEILLLLNKSFKNSSTNGIRIQNVCTVPGHRKRSNHTSKVGLVRAFSMHRFGANFNGGEIFKQYNFSLS